MHNEATAAAVLFNGSDDEDRHQQVGVVTTFEIDQYIVEPLRAGASGFLLKSNEPAELVHARSASWPSDRRCCPCR